MTDPITINKMFYYKYEDIKNKDEQITETLKDNQYIHFRHIDYDSTLDIAEYDIADENFDKCGYHYQDFLDGKELKFQDSDEIVYGGSFMSLHFDSPAFRDHTTFTIRAEDEMKGFTRGELAIKCMKYYHLQFYLCQNYDMDKGCFKTNDVIEQLYNKRSDLNKHLESEHKKNPSFDFLIQGEQITMTKLKLPEPLFRPVLYYDEYTDNGLYYLKYNKQKDYWIFNCINYV